MKGKKLFYAKIGIFVTLDKFADNLYRVVISKHVKKKKTGPEAGQYFHVP